MIKQKTQQNRYQREFPIPYWQYRISSGLPSHDVQTRLPILIQCCNGVLGHPFVTAQAKEDAKIVTEEAQLSFSVDVLLPRKDIEEPAETHLK